MGFSTSTCTEFVEVLASKATTTVSGAVSKVTGTTATVAGTDYTVADVSVFESLDRLGNDFTCCVV